MQASPAQLVFGRDMIMHTKLVAQRHQIQNRVQSRTV
jgi:hypothetical protein